MTGTSKSLALTSATALLSAVWRMLSWVTSPSNEIGMAPEYGEERTTSWSRLDRLTWPSPALIGILTRSCHELQRPSDIMCSKRNAGKAYNVLG